MRLNPDKDKKEFHQAMFDLLTPVVKGWCTEQSVDIASIGIQVHGGMGFMRKREPPNISETPELHPYTRVQPVYKRTILLGENIV